MYLVMAAEDEAWATATIAFAINGRDVEQTIALVSLPRPPFGGRRWFFVCPLTGARACRLFLPAGADRFLSREAHGLRYAVEHASASDADITKVIRLHTRIAGEPPLERALSPLPLKRKGMHQQTYDRLTLRLLVAKGRVVGRLDAWLEDMRARCRPSRDPS